MFINPKERQWRGTIIDGRGHLLGRLAAVVAKELLKGGKVTILRAEQINVSGTHIRNKFKFLRYLKLTNISNPRKGPKHYRSPAHMFWRVIRGMLPYRVPRGREAMFRLKVFEGMPMPWATKRKMCVIPALRHLRLQPGRPYTTLGAIAHDVGWKYKAVVEELEVKRKEKAAKFHARKKQLLRLKRIATKFVDLVIPPIKLGDPKIKIGTL
jgi:large subunit ribosomal protein L13Ae